MASVEQVIANLKKVVEGISKLNRSLKGTVVKLWNECKSQNNRIKKLEAFKASIDHFFKKVQLIGEEPDIDEVRFFVSAKI